MAMTETGPVTVPAGRRRAPSLREWLAPALPGDRITGWLAPLIVTGFAAFLRFHRLSIPHSVVFDETYYAKDAAALLKFGWEHNTVKDADKLLIQDPGASIWTNGPSFVAHPPGGKWMIAIGEALFGTTPFGWRFMPALAGVLSVLVLCRVARRMTGSTMLGCAAGLLLALDGLHFVTSRAALLDIFVMFWILCAFGCLVVDRDRSRMRLAERLERYGGSSFGPFVTHGWRITAGVCLGMACATKWTGVFYVAAFGLLALVWDLGARRAAGVRRPYSGALLLDAGPAFVSLVVVAGLTYFASWWGWIFKPGGWGRGKVAGFPLARPFEAIPDLWRYHADVLSFHVGLNAKHPYQSWPWDWPIMRRPVAFFYTEPSGCGAERCSREILGIGTPALWWGGLVALIVILFVWLRRRDWRAGAILLGYLAGLVPWLPSAWDNRTMFLFYATPMLPFMVLAIVLALGLLIGPDPRESARPVSGTPTAGALGGIRWRWASAVPTWPGTAGPPGWAVPGDGLRDAGIRRVAGAAIAGAFVLIVLVNFAYFYPILSAQVIPYGSWDARIWFQSWV